MWHVGHGRVDQSKRREWKVRRLYVNSAIKFSIPMIQRGEGNSVSANKGSSFIRNKNFRGCTLSAPPGFKMLRYHSMLLSIGECNLHSF